MITNNKGMVLDVAETYQLQIGQSQDLCGNYGVATLTFAGLPGYGPKGNANDVKVLADNIANKFKGGQLVEQGSTIEDMYNYIAWVSFNGKRALHYQVIPATEQHIKIAIKAGYPILAVANELNILEVTTGSRPPYPWHLDATHIMPLMGIDNNGNYIVADYLNNNFKGQWPFHYNANVLSPSWACAIQVVGPDPANPWLKHIPNGDPTTWGSFNAQNFKPPQAVASGANDVVYSIPQAITMARTAGFTGDALVTIVAIAMAESNLHSHPTDNVEGNTPPSRDRGILQINSYWHPEVPDSLAYDAQASFKWAYRATSSGTTFKAWTTYINGRYQSFVEQVKQYI